MFKDPVFYQMPYQGYAKAMGEEIFAFNSKTKEWEKVTDPDMKRSIAEDGCVVNEQAALKGIECLSNQNFASPPKPASLNIKHFVANVPASNLARAAIKLFKFIK